MGVFASLYWGTGHTFDSKPGSFNQIHWNSYIKQMASNKKIDSANQLANVFKISKPLANAIWAGKETLGTDLGNMFALMDDEKDGIITEAELNSNAKSFVSITKQAKEIAQQAKEQSHVKVTTTTALPKPTQKGTGLPKNAKVYAASSENETAGYDGVKNKNSFFTANTFSTYKSTGSFQDAIDSNRSFLTDIIKQHPISSLTGNDLKKGIKVEHALIFYDPEVISFKNDANIAEATLKAKNPGIVIKKIAATSKKDYTKGLELQKAYIDKHPNCNVLVYNSSHGNKGDSINGDIQGVCLNSDGYETLTEGQAEKYAQSISTKVKNMFFIYDNCHSGAFADATYKK